MTILFAIANVLFLQVNWIFILFALTIDLFIITYGD